MGKTEPQPRTVECGQGTERVRVRGQDCEDVRAGDRARRGTDGRRRHTRQNHCRPRQRPGARQARHRVCYEQLCRGFANPSRAGYTLLNGRYLVGKPRYVRHVAIKEDSPAEMLTYTDTGFAGCPRTLRSTSGGVCLRGCHPIKAYSKAKADRARRNRGGGVHTSWPAKRGARLVPRMAS